MNKKIVPILLTAAVLLSLVSLGFKGEDKSKSVRKTATNDNYEYIAINQILMWVSNNGDGSHDPRTDGNGFYWPGGENAQNSAIFEDGLIFGGKVGREIRVNGNTHRQGLQAGKILEDGTPDDPSLEKYRVFKIRRGWQDLPPGPTKDAYQKDWEEWPVEDGAPWVDTDGDGIFTAGVDEPELIGDEVLWYVANDMDPQRSTFTYGTLPMGLEFQTTIFGFKRTGPLGDMVFKKYKMINKGSNTIKDMILGYWSDTDLGDAGDDFTGADITIDATGKVTSLGYTYNGDNQDDIYGTPPPAVGYDFFQGPIVPGTAADSAKFLGEWRHGFRNLPMTAFVFYINAAGIPWRDPQQGVPAGSIEFYNYLSGYVWDGTEFIDPNTGQPTKFILTGDPVAGTGWYEGPGWPNGPDPGDRRHVMASGPFTMAPGDTQEIVVGIVIATGTSNLNSITALKAKDLKAQVAYDLDFQLTPPPPSPAVHAIEEDRSITLWWETNAESYSEGDPLIYRQNLSDTTFDFQGYRLWQFKDQSGSDPVLLQTYDIVDSVTSIWDYQTINGAEVLVPIIVGNNSGLKRFYPVTKDAYTNGPLFNGNPYYFAVTAYGYSGFSSPPYLESPPTIIEVIPGKASISQTSEFHSGENLNLTQINGNSDARVFFKVVDPMGLNGHSYEVSISKMPPDSAKDADTLAYTLVDVTAGDTIILNSEQLVTLSQDDVTKEYFVSEIDTVGKPVTDGFMLIVQNVGEQQLFLTGGKYSVKELVEVKGPGGTVLQQPKDVWNHLNSTGEWKILAKSLNGLFNWQTTESQEGLGYSDYEIRFTGTSQYYISGHQLGLPSTAVFKSDTLAEDTLPFEVWDLGRSTSPDDDKRLMIKVLDNNRAEPGKAVPDRKWSQLPNGDWEELYFYDPVTFDPANPPFASGPSQPTSHKFGALSFSGNVPAEGTVIRLETWKPLQSGDKFQGVPTAPNPTDLANAKNNLDQISVFPNPYFGANSLERDKYQRFVRFTNLPNEVSVRIFSLSGVFIQKLEKASTDQYLDWDLRNKDGLPVASGMYLAYLDMPGIGTKIMKIAVIMETQFIDRL